MQSIPNVLSAVKGGQADGTINAGTQMIPMMDAGDVKLIGWLAEDVRYQSAITFVSTKMTNERSDLLKRYLRALHKGFKDYHDAFTGPGEVRQDGPTADATIALISKYTGQSPETTRLSIAYATPDGGLGYADIVKQVDWFKSQGMLKGNVDGNAIIDKRYAIDTPVQ